MSSIFWLTAGFLIAFLCTTKNFSLHTTHRSIFPSLLSPFKLHEDTGSDSPSRVLYAVRTCPKYYNTRLKDVLSTYLATVQSDRILLVGNFPQVISAPDHTDQQKLFAVRNVTVQSTDGSDGSKATVCADDHSQGITCIEGRALFFAYQRRKHFDWIFMVDDDVYVHRHNVEMTVSRLDPLLPLVYSVGGCAPNVKCAKEAGGGICGGGGCKCD